MRKTRNKWGENVRNMSSVPLRSCKREGRVCPLNLRVGSLVKTFSLPELFPASPPSRRASGMGGGGLADRRPLGMSAKFVHRRTLGVAGFERVESSSDSHLIQVNQYWKNTWSNNKKQTYFMFGLHSLVDEKLEQTRRGNIPFGVIFVCLERPGKEMSRWEISGWWFLKQADICLGRDAIWLIWIREYFYCIRFVQINQFFIKAAKIC